MLVFSYSLVKNTFTKGAFRIVYNYRFPCSPLQRKKSSFAKEATINSDLKVLCLPTRHRFTAGMSNSNEKNSDPIPPVSDRLINKIKFIAKNCENLIRTTTTKIEFYVGDVPDSVPVLPLNARFTRLGFVALSDNEKTSFKARELKSVHVDAIGHFVKLVIHKNHTNRHNLFNQVGLIAINVIGDKGMKIQERESSEIEDSDRNIGDVRVPDYFSPLDDLAFDMYQDPEVAQIIRRLDVKKQEAVSNEQFEFAQRIKTVMVHLQKVGERLGKSEVEKRQAVENEDYDKAKLKKSQMDEYRRSMYNQLQISELLDITPVPLPNLSVPVHIVSEPAPAFVRHHSPPRSNEKIESYQLPYLPQPVVSSPLVNAHTAYDERPLPAIRSKGMLYNVEGSETNRGVYTPRSAAGSRLDHVTNRPQSQATETLIDEEVSPDEDHSGVNPEPMSENDQREAGTIIEVFGLNLASKLYSKHWSLRQEGLETIYKQMVQLEASSSRDDARNMMRAAMQAFNKFVRDNVLAVFLVALNLHKMILLEFVSKHKISKTEISGFIERTIQQLLLKTSDTSVRTRDSAKSLIIEESQFPEVKPLNIVTHECVKPFKLNIAPRLAVSRTEILLNLYEEHGLHGSGLTIENMMAFLNQALSHNSGEVRERAEKLIILLYNDVGQPVKNFLPPDDEKTRKNLLYKQMFTEFDKIDRKVNRPSDTKYSRRESDVHKPALVEPEQVKQQQTKETPPSNRTEQKENKNNNRAAKHTKEPSNEPKQDLENAQFPGDGDHRCIFCGETNKSFNQYGLDRHYVNACPVLMTCPCCSQVVEISGLTVHLLKECQNQNQFAECPRCGEAISTKDFHQHTIEMQCLPLDPKLERCPLCHANIPKDEVAWRDHLVRPDGCKNNPRRLRALSNKPVITRSPAGHVPKANSKGE